MSGQAGGALRHDGRESELEVGPEVGRDGERELGPLESIRECIAECDSHLLVHRYFTLCEQGAIDREAILEIVKQLYCFSVFFERILTRRIAEFSSVKDHRVVQIARGHLKEEIGHAMLFEQCLVQNGFPAEQVPHIAPKMFTKALFGYLLATVQHENEYVTNIAIMQVMESIGYHFFRATLSVLRDHGMMSAAFAEHSEADEDHRSLGLDLVSSFDAHTLADSRRIIQDVYRLMGFVLDEWLDGYGEAGGGRITIDRHDLHNGRTHLASHISSLLPEHRTGDGSPNRNRR